MASVAAICGLLVASCSSEPEVTAPVVELSTTTVTTLPPTTVTTEAPTTTVDPRIAEVEAAVAGFHQVQLSVLLDDSEPVELIEAFATGQVLRSVTENTLGARAEASYYEGSISFSPLSTSIESADIAMHTSCTVDGIAQFDNEGTLLIPADEVGAIWTYQLTAEEGAWRVSGISIGELCATS